MAALRGDISFRYLKQFFLVISLNKLAVLIFFSLGKNLIVILDDLKVQSKCLLAHLAKGNVSFCHHLASVVHRLLTFHILISSSETPPPNELKLGRKHL
jgi:hypothetical protein